MKLVLVLAVFCALAYFAEAQEPFPVDTAAKCSAPAPVGNGTNVSADADADVAGAGAGAAATIGSRTGNLIGRGRNILNGIRGRIANNLRRGGNGRGLRRA